MARSRKLCLELGMGLVLFTFFICSPVASQTCGPAQNVTLTAQIPTATTAFLQWVYPLNFPSTCVQQLTVCWTSVDVDSTTTCQSLQPTALSLSMTGLQPCTVYNIRLTVKPLSGVSTATTTTVTTSAASAENVTVSWLGTTSLRVSWQYHAQRLSCITRFVAAVCDNNNQALLTCRRYPVLTSALTSNYSVGVVELLPCRVYHVRVVTEVNQLNAVPLESPQTPFFLEGVVIGNVNATDVGPSFMNVGWSSQPVDAACNHTLSVCAVPMAEGRTRCLTNLNATTPTPVNITNLRPCTPYQLRLDLATTGGNSAVLGPVLPTFSTDYQLVRSLQLSRSRNQILARWVPVFADPPCAKGYRICWNDTTGLECEDTFPNTTSFTILDLEGGSYVVQVAGIFFDNSLTTSVSQVARISGASRMFFSPVILMLTVACGKVIKIT